MLGEILPGSAVVTMLALVQLAGVAIGACLYHREVDDVPDAADGDRLFLL